MYQSLINPYLTYGLTTWGNASKAYINKIPFLQKRDLRLIYFTDRNENAIPLSSKNLPLNFIYYKSVCNLMYDININSWNRIPSHLRQKKYFLFFLKSKILIVT